MGFIPYAIAGLFIGVGVSIYAHAYHRDAMRMSDHNWGDAVRYKPETANAREA